MEKFGNINKNELWKTENGDKTCRTQVGKREK